MRPNTSMLGGIIGIGIYAGLHILLVFPVPSGVRDLRTLDLWAGFLVGFQKFQLLAGGFSSVLVG